MSNEDIESRAAELLGQIQASLAEYTRQLNENGARLRRESDEAHRQHDVALEALKKLDARAKGLIDEVHQIADQISSNWRPVIVEGARKASEEQAKAYIAEHLRVAEQNLRRSSEDLKSLAHVISYSLGWRQMLTSAFVGLIAAVVGMGVVVWKFVG